MFTYSANVKCINGVDTWLEFMFKGYTGTLSKDIESISVTGPKGLITNKLNTFHIYDDLDYLLYQIKDSMPNLGKYNFSVTINKTTVKHTDEQIVNRKNPIVNKQTLIPAPDSIVPVNTTFEWGVIPDPGYNIYYGIQIRDDKGNYVVNQRYITNFKYNISLEAGDYTWQIIIVDGNGSWKSVNNRTHGNWESFTIK